MKNKRLKIILVSASLLLITGVNSFAESDEDFSLNEVRYYGQSNCQISDSPNRTVYLENNSHEDTLLFRWVSKNYAAVTSLAAEYGLPWEPIMAQGAIESDYGTSGAYEQRNNIFVLGPDGNGLNKDASYPDTETSWRAIFEYLRLKSGVSRDKIFSKDSMRTPSLYINAIMESGYNPSLSQDKSYEELLRELTSEIELMSDRVKLQSSKEILKNTLAVEGNIERNRGKGVNNFGNATDYTSSECNCGGDAGASGVRWSNFWVSNNSLFGSQKAPVIGMNVEGRLVAKDYGLDILESSEQLKINFRIKNGEGNLVDGDPYSAYPNKDYPHFLVDIKKKRIFQYFPINLSSAAKSNENTENGIVIDIVGFTDEANSSSNYYLWDTDKNTNTEWKYLATLVNALYEESEKTLLAPEDGDAAEIWAKISSRLNLKEHKQAIKCGTVEGADFDLDEYEIRRFMNYYNKSVSISDYNLPLNSKTQPASFVAYFVSRYTPLDTKNMAWGEPRDVVKSLAAKNSSLESGNDPAPLAVFASTEASALCGGFNCGSTGIIMSIKNGLAITIEQAYPSGKAEVKKHSLVDLKNTKTGTSFVYLRSAINEEELKLGKMGQ